ncbi:MAG: FYDLN acid domain-containing protein [Alphaproteobacteria bacterium]
MSDPRGKKWTCFECQNKFYDLKKSPVICPKCKTNQEGGKPTPPKKVEASKPTKKKKEEDFDIDEVIDLDEDLSDNEDDMLEVSQDVSIDDTDEKEDI